MTTVVAATSYEANARRKVPKVLRDDGNEVKGEMVPRGADAASFTTRRAKPFMLIDPRYSKAAQRWDILTVLALIFTAIVTPFEVAFLETPQSWSAAWKDPLFYINRLVDVIFSIDLVLQFFLIYPEQNDASGVRWVESRRQIAVHYLKSWFALDFFSTAMCIIDFISVDSGENPEVNIQALRVLRVLRALRLIKLVRLVRASRMFKRWECKIAINYGALALGRCVVGVIVLSHWFACLFALQTVFFDSPVQSVLVMGSDPPEYVDTWKGEFLYCTATGATSPDGSAEAECLDPWALYCVAVYWAIMTITSIGYGDVGPARRNATEQILTAIMMLVGGFLWGQVVGTFCGVIATFDPHGTEFRRNMDDLNVFMASKHLPVEMRRRLREYFHQTKHLQMANSQRHLFHMMSPALQGEVAWTANEEWLKRIPFLNHCGEDFKVMVAMALTPKVFAPGEVAPKGYLYVINRGLALYGARVLTAGKIWGDDVVMLNAAFHSPYNARAMNYLEVYTISRDRLFELAEDYPASKRAMRREALFMAMRRALCDLVSETKKSHLWKNHGRLSFTVAGLKLKDKHGSGNDLRSSFQNSVAAAYPVRPTGPAAAGSPSTALPAQVGTVGEERADALFRMCEELKEEQMRQRVQLTCAPDHTRPHPQPSHPSPRPRPHPPTNPHTHPHSHPHTHPHTHPTPTLTPTFSLIRRVLQLLEAQSGSREPLRPEHPTTAYVGGGGSTPARSSAGSSTGSEVGSSVGASGRRRRSRSTATPAIATLAATALAASLGSPKASVAADAAADGGVASFAT